MRDVQADPADLLSRLRTADRARSSSSGRVVRRALGDAVAAAAEVEERLAELRARGYRQLPDGRWVNPAGMIVRGR